jgi:hypothetical protein
VAQIQTVQIGKHAVPVVANEAGYDHDGESFLIYTLQTHCCNCGKRDALLTIDTHFVEATDTVYTEQRTMRLALPYCKPCGNRANKYPVSSALKVVVGFAIWLGLLMVLAISLPLNAPQVVRILTVVLSIAAVVALFHFIGRPKAPMTSNYTPVKIKQFGGRPGAARAWGSAALFLAQVHGIAKLLTRVVTSKDPNATGKLNFSFSNPTYAKAFGAVNAERVKGGSIVVR